MFSAKREATEKEDKEISNFRKRRGTSMGAALLLGEISWLIHHAGNRWVVGSVTSVD